MEFRALQDAPIPAHLPGCLLAAAGVASLRRADTGPLRASFRLWIPALFCLYFAPFVTWWHDAPYSDYLLANIVAAAVAALGLLAGVCREAVRVARVLGLTDFVREARWGTALCGLLPGILLGGLTVWTSVRAALSDTSLYGEWFEVLFNLPRGTAVLAVLPFTVAMACAWRARAACLGALRADTSATPAA